MLLHCKTPDNAGLISSILYSLTGASLCCCYCHQHCLGSDKTRYSAVHSVSPEMPSSFLKEERRALPCELMERQRNDAGYLFSYTEMKGSAGRTAEGSLRDQQMDAKADEAVTWNVAPSAPACLLSRALTQCRNCTNHLSPCRNRVAESGQRAAKLSGYFPTSGRSRAEAAGRATWGERSRPFRR